LWLNLERTLDKRCGKMGVVRVNRVTPSVAGPGDTNPSDATGSRTGENAGGI